MKQRGKGFEDRVTRLVCIESGRGMTHRFGDKRAMRSMKSTIKVVPGLVSSTRIVTRFAGVRALVRRGESGREINPIRSSNYPDGISFDSSLSPPNASKTPPKIYIRIFERCILLQINSTESFLRRYIKGRAATAARAAASSST